MNKKLILGAMMVVVFAACNNSTQQKTEDNAMNSDSSTMQQEQPDMHNAQSSLDWMGTYEGTLPCADCEGIKTTIMLNEDGTFTAKEEYMNKPDGNMESKGTFTWDASGTNVTLTDGKDFKQSYKVIEGAILQLDTEGNEITGNMADLYKLSKK